MNKNSSLGKGLQSLIPQEQSRLAGLKSKYGQGKESLTEVEISKISPNPHQPREFLNQQSLGELASSIEAHGILQPLVVTKKEKGQYELIAGHRRLAAAKKAKLKKVPVVVRDASDQQKLEMTLVENLQRDNLNPVEQAQAYQQLVNEFNLNQAEIAKRTGQNRSTIANVLRLITLPVEIQKGLAQGKISEGHARAILMIGSPQKQQALYQLVVKNKLNVRQSEDWARKASGQSKKITRKTDPEVRELEEKIEEVLSTKVKITKKGKSGKIIITFYSPQELEGIVKKICSR